MATIPAFAGQNGGGTGPAALARPWFVLLELLTAIFSSDDERKRPSSLIEHHLLGTGSSAGVVRDRGPCKGTA